MKLRMIARGVVDRELREVGAVLLATDHEQVDSMLRSGVAVPADSGDYEAWRASLARASS